MVIGAIGGFRKGFILEIVSLLALILAVIGGFHFLHWGIAILTEKFEMAGKFLPFLAFFLIFIAIILTVNMVGRIIRKIAHMAFLGGLDKLAGAILGALKFIFFFSLIIWGFQVFGIGLPQHLQDDSFLYLYIVSVAPATVDLFGYIIPASSGLLDKIAELLNFSAP